ncbi:MAG: alpha/beta fold hydrolase [Solirubrobacterales bacterium]
MHATGTNSGWFEPVTGALSESLRLITYDRRGWGRSEPVDDYRRTSIAEQAIEAGALLKDLEIEEVTVLGVGFGAVVALEMALAEPATVKRAILVEPPLFALVTAATGGMSADVEEIRNAAEEGGEEAAYGLFLAGELPTLGSGADRLNQKADHGPNAAHTFLVELPAVPAWPMDPNRIAGIRAGVTVATTPSTSPLLLEAANAVAPRIPGADRVFTTRDGTEAVTELLAELEDF